MTDFGWRSIPVLECSQVRTPADYWALYLERVAVRSPDTFGRNLDAFWDALSRGGPGAPAEPCFIEMRNYGVLAAGHPEFVEKLASLAAELNALKGAFELRLYNPQSDVPPRGGLYQHERFLSHEAKGMEVLAMFQESDGPGGLVLLQGPGGICQHIFLETGLVFWSEYDIEEVLADYESHELEDVSALLGPGPHILETVEGGRRNGGSVDVTLMSGATIRLDPLTLSDPDSDFVLTVEPAP